ncbi:MAG: recombinase family protein [Actinobacteria bacterium]|nr:recombinase family protein [Actinomycetota bacterium]
MARIGCARVSTIDQHPQAQAAALAEVGCAGYFTDRRQLQNCQQSELDACLVYLRLGDELVVWKLDHFSGVGVHILSLAPASGCRWPRPGAMNPTSPRKRPRNCVWSHATCGPATPNMWEGPEQARIHVSSSVQRRGLCGSDQFRLG